MRNDESELSSLSGLPDDRLGVRAQVELLLQSSKHSYPHPSRDENDSHREITLHYMRSAPLALEARIVWKVRYLPPKYPRVLNPPISPNRVS